MPDVGDDEHSGAVIPRKPSKSDYVTARQFSGGVLGLPCRLWVMGYRGRMTPAQWQHALSRHSQSTPS